MVLALFYVVAIRFRSNPDSYRDWDEATKSVHFQAAKIKQFLQSRKYIYFWRQKFIYS